MRARSVEELELIAAIADGLPVGVWVATAPDGVFVYANRAFEEIMGMGPEPSAAAGGYSGPYGIRTRDGAPYPEDKLPFTRALAARASVVVDDIAIHRRDGRKVLVRAVARPLFDNAGVITNITVAFTDVTAEVRATEKHALTEQRLRHVMSHVPIVLFAYDAEGVVTLSEGRGLDELNWSPQEFLGHSIFDLYRDNAEVIANTRRALDGEAFTCITQVASFILETTFTPVRDPAGNVSGAIGVSMDITERKQMEARLVQAERLSSMGTLAATVAHEVNNPLTYVLSNLDVLSDQLTRIGADLPPARLKDALTVVADAREGADRVRQIVRGLKSFSRPNDDPAVATDVCQVLDRSIALADNELRHRARLIKSYGKVGPVLADDVRLSQVFVNLLVNAAHAITEGSAAAHEIRIDAFEEDGRVVVAIQDTGAGIAPEVRGRIFEPFFTTKPVGIGTGLGLSICYGIIKGFGGTIDVESVVGKGSTFRVRLPVLAGAASCAVPSGPAPLSIARGRLLIVDDDARVARALCLLLDTEHDVEVKTHPTDALDLLMGGSKFDVIFCDLMMPEMSGMDLYAVLADSVPDQAERMVFVTGGAFTTAANDFLDRVPNPRLEKPFNLAQLESILYDRLNHEDQETA